MTDASNSTLANSSQASGNAASRRSKKQDRLDADICWSAVRLGDVLERVSNAVNVVDDRQYQEIGIRSHGKGLFHKPIVSGKSLGSKRVFHVEPNCFVLNIVFAWEQAVARTTERERGLIASHRFPMYRPKGDIDIDFLLWFFKTPRGKRQLYLASPGGAGRNKTLNQEDFEDIKILAPSAAEQRRIADILNSWDHAIAQTEALIDAKQRRSAELTRRLLHEGGERNGRLSDLAAINPRSPRVDNDSLVSFVPMDAISEDGRLISNLARRRGEIGSGYTGFVDNDVLVAKITPCFENGKGGHVCGLHSGVGFGSTEFHVLRPNAEGDARFIHHHIMAAAFRRNGERYMTGSAGQRRVPAEFIEDYRIPLMDAERRRNAASILDAADNEIDLLQQELQRLTDQKRGLMQKLLSGDMRLSSMEAAE